MVVVRVALTGLLLLACSPTDSAISERCRRIIETDAEARSALEEAEERDAPENEVRRLRVAFGRAHDALFDSGCLTS